VIKIEKSELISICAEMKAQPCGEQAGLLGTANWQGLRAQLRISTRRPATGCSSEPGVGGATPPLAG
jgi:hypothetical protein